MTLAKQHAWQWHLCLLGSNHDASNVLVGSLYGHNNMLVRSNLKVSCCSETVISQRAIPGQRASSLSITVERRGARAGEPYSPLATRPGPPGFTRSLSNKTLSFLLPTGCCLVTNTLSLLFTNDSCSAGCGSYWST